ncbi:hypothetical protein DM558_07545 [Entomomonas moraniae]|uniref:Tape measure protein N-terminal domain-containing protein n=1 Tax=Entomomonas moraniae TaxID=2213226 RepID=A0A3Q9JLN7_9GAMM|nr:tape measure protein [Entomomonas moraniae]AZS50641.1 hypothetical protein DM558_07545 [Entomomonas moraniae]
MTDGIKIPVDASEVQAAKKQLQILKSTLEELDKTVIKTDGTFGEFLDSHGARNNIRDLITKVTGLEKQITEAEKSAVKFGNTAASSANQANKSFASLRTGVAGLVASFLSIAGFSIGLRMANDYGQLASRIKMATESEEEFQEVQTRIMETANRTYKPLAEQQELFIRTNSAMKELGYTTNDTLNFLDSVSSSLTVNSASAEGFATAVNAISKSMTKGVVSGDEWRAIVNTMPTAVRDIADYLSEVRGGVEVSETEVKKLAESGQLMTQTFIEAANRVRESKNELAENMPTTMNDAMQRFTNNLSSYLSAADDSTGATDKLVGGINLLTDNLEGVGKILASITAGAMAIYTAKVYDSTKATVASTYAKIADTLAERNAAKANVARTATILAQTKAQLGLTANQSQLTAATLAHEAAQKRLAATTGILKGLMSGGPLGLLGVVATVATGWLLFRDNTEQARLTLDKFGSTAEEAKQKLKELNTEQAAKGVMDLSKQLKEQNLTLEKEVNKALSLIDYWNNALSTQSNKGYISEDQATKAQEALYKIRKAFESGGDGAEKYIQELYEISPAYESATDSLRNYSSRIADAKKEVDNLSDALGIYKNRVDDDTKSSKESGNAKVKLKEETNNLNSEIQKLTKSLDEQYQSGLGLDGAIASIESKIADLGGQSGEAAAELAKLNDALDKLKGAKAKLDNLNDLKMLEDIKESARTMRMDEFDKKADKVQSSTLSDEQKKQALDLIVQQKAYSDSKKTSKGSAKSGNDKENYLKNLEKEAAQLKLTTQEIRERELAEKNLSGEMLIRAKAALEIINADEKERQAMANTNDNIQLQIELLRSLGDEAGAASLELKARLTEMRKEFEKNGNTEGLSLLPKVERVNDFKIQMDSIKSEIDKLFNYQSQQEQSIQAQVTAGIITQYEAQKRLTELHEKTAKSVSGMLPQLQQMSKLEGEMGQQASDYLTQVQTRLIELQATTNELENAFRNGLQDGIQSSIDGLVRGTMNLQEALKNFVDSIASNILNVITQNIAQQATDGIMGGLNSLNSMFGFGADTVAVGIDENSPQAVAISIASQEGAMAMQMGIEQGAMTAAQAISSAFSSMGAMNGGLGGDGGLFGNVTQQASEAVGAINTVKATKTAADASLTASAVSSAATTQATTQAAAASATASWTPAATAASVASFGSAAMIGLSALMMVLTSMKAFATGGHVRGEGTGTSDSIPAMLSNGEFVTRAKVVKQPGMLDFMKDLNNRGWGAVNDLNRVHHSTGGLAGVPAPSAPSLPSINLAPMENTNSTTVKNNMMLNVIDDPNKVGNSLLNNEHTQDSFYVFLTENNQRVRQILQF